MKKNQEVLNRRKELTILIQKAEEIPNDKERRKVLKNLNEEFNKLTKELQKNVFGE